MHWHTETTVAGLGTQQYAIDLTPEDALDSQPDQAVIDAAYAAAQDLATVINAPPEALVSIDRHYDSETTTQTISVTVAVA